MKLPSLAKISDWNIGTRVIAGFLVVTALTAVAGVTGIINVGIIGSSVDRISYEEAPIADASMEMILALVIARDTMGEFMNATSTIATTEAGEITELENIYEQTVKDFDGFADAILEGGTYEGVSILATDNEELQQLVIESNRIHDELFQESCTELIQAGDAGKEKPPE